MNKSGIEWCDHTWNPITGWFRGLVLVDNKSIMW